MSNRTKAVKTMQRQQNKATISKKKKKTQLGKQEEKPPFNYDISRYNTLESPITNKLIS
jgi:hypothetical protein